MNTAKTALWADRTGPYTYIGRNSRGGEVNIARISEDGAFSPSELFALGLATCNLLSADSVLGRRLGLDFDATVAVQTELVPGENRYASGDIEIAVDLEKLDPDERQQLIELVHRAVDRSCTVGRTLDQGMPHTLTLTSTR